MEEKLIQEAIDKAFEKFDGKFSTPKQVETAVEAVKTELLGKLDGVATKEDINAAIEKFSNNLTKDLEKMKNKEESPITVKDAVLNFFEENNIKSVSDMRKFVGQEIELKADNPVTNTSYTGNVSRTQIVNPQVRFPNERPKAFLGQGITVGVVESDKNVILWNVGTYTEAVGYIGENVDATDVSGVAGSTGTNTEKTRKLSKIVARMIVSADTFEDLSQFAQRVQTKLMEKVDLWLDQKIWDGEGNNSTKDTEIYGVATGQVTAFDAAAIPQVVNPNIGDIADACRLMARKNNHDVDTVWMSETMAYKYRREKDSTGQYIINQLITGELVMNGMRVITSETLFGGATEKMLVGAARNIQLWVKRNLSTEIERVPKTDSYHFYIYGRQQVLVEDEDIKGLIYVSDVATALDAIDAGLAGE